VGAELRGRGQRAEGREPRAEHDEAPMPSRIPELQTCRAVLGMSSVCHCPSLIVNWTRLGDNVPAKRSDTGLRWHHEEIWRRISFPTVCHRTLCVVRPRHTLIPPGTFSTARDRGQGQGQGAVGSGAILPVRPRIWDESNRRKKKLFACLRAELQSFTRTYLGRCATTFLI
jgi:hypothetical protein